ncbi:MAG: peptidoglycan-binding protein [Xanthobacteraceae bacterium]|nr:peptidoglycan-binding protein [Xanthobacteraceae bacterium]
MSFAQVIVEPMRAPELRARRARGEARASARTRPVRLPIFFRALIQRPRASLFAIAGAAGSAAIVINALYLQPGPHPAPIFAIAPPAPAIASNEVAPPARRLGPGPVAEIVRSEPNPMPVKAPAVAHTPAPTRDPIGNLINSSRPLAPIQRALSEFGYGPLETNGTLGPNTRAAIERFERDHKMPVTGQISDRLIRELSSLTGRPL